MFHFLVFADFSRLFEQLATVRGNPKVQTEFVREIIHEAQRFKRRSLIFELEQFLQQLVSHTIKPHGNNESLKAGFS